MLGRLGLRGLLDLPPLGQGELRRPAAFVPRVKGAEPVRIEVPDDIADPVLAGERDPRDRPASMPWADSSTICARRQVTTDPVPRRTIRTSRRPSSSSISRTRKRSVTGPVCRTGIPASLFRRANVTCYGTSWVSIYSRTS